MKIVLTSTNDIVLSKIHGSLGKEKYFDKKIETVLAVMFVFLRYKENFKKTQSYLGKIVQIKVPLYCLN